MSPTTTVVRRESLIYSFAFVIVVAMLTTYGALRTACVFRESTTTGGLDVLAIVLGFSLFLIMFSLAMTHMAAMYLRRRPPDIETGWGGFERG